MKANNIITNENPSGRSLLEASFSMTLKCTVTRTIKVSHHSKSVYILLEGGSATSTLKADQDMGIPGDQEGVCDVLRGLMRAFMWLQKLKLIEEQWEVILPENEVPVIADLARMAYWYGCIAHAMLHLCVNEQWKFKASKALLMPYALADAVLVGCWDCSICLKDATNPTAGHAVEMHGYSLAFHCRCMTSWFCRSSTCPTC